MLSKLNDFPHELSVLALTTWGFAVFQSKLLSLGKWQNSCFGFGLSKWTRRAPWQLLRKWIFAISCETLKSSWLLAQQIATSTCSYAAIVIISCLDHLFSPQKMHTLCMKLVDLLCKWPSWWFNSQTEMSGSVSFDRNHELMPTSTGTMFAV